MLFLALEIGSLRLEAFEIGAEKKIKRGRLPLRNGNLSDLVVLARTVVPYGLTCSLRYLACTCSLRWLYRYKPKPTVGGALR